MMNRRNICRKNANRRHVFSATTHQCECGIWERGFKPAKQFIKPRAECQICERQQALDSGDRLGHHGYRRPGWGFITGDCYGQGHAAYPETDALTSYLEALNNAISGWKKSLSDLPNIQSLNYTYKLGFGNKRELKTVQILRGTESRFVFEEGRTQFPSFDQLESNERHRLESEIRNGHTELSRVEKRIAAAAELIAVAAK